MDFLVEIEKEATARTAVLVTGNPKFIEGNDQAEAFYRRVAKYLTALGYETTRDPGLPHTMPTPADLWVGHSRGADRFRFAPEGQRHVAFGSSQPGAVNHPKDVLMEPGQTPDASHYRFTPAMRQALRDQANPVEKEAAGIKSLAKAFVPVATKAVKPTVKPIQQAATGKWIPNQVRRPLLAAGTTASIGQAAKSYYDLKPVIQDPGMAAANALQGRYGLTDLQSASMGRGINRLTQSPGQLWDAAKRFGPYLANRWTKPEAPALPTSIPEGAVTASRVASPMGWIAGQIAAPAVHALTPSKPNIDPRYGLEALKTMRQGGDRYLDAGLFKSLYGEGKERMGNWWDNFRAPQSVMKSGKADVLPGGLGDRRKLTDFPREEVQEGKKVEREHTNNPRVAAEIAKDHLTEDVRYYEKLEKMEKESAPAWLKGISDGLVNMNPHARNALIGAGVGGVVGGMTHGFKGALGGAALGAGAGALSPYASKWLQGNQPAQQEPHGMHSYAIDQALQADKIPPKIRRPQTNVATPMPGATQSPAVAPPQQPKPPAAISSAPVNPNPQQVTDPNQSFQKMLGMGRGAARYDTYMPGPADLRAVLDTPDVNSAKQLVRDQARNQRDVSRTQGLIDGVPGSYGTGPNAAAREQAYLKKLHEQLRYYTDEAPGRSGRPITTPPVQPSSP
jgi:hypothetical protein